MNGHMGWLILLGELAFLGLVGVAVLAFLLRRNILRMRRLQQQVRRAIEARDAARRAQAEVLGIPAYLKREWRETALSQAPEGSIEASVRLFRLHWLDAERRALRHQGQRASDREMIVNLMRPIFQLAQEQLPDAAETSLRGMLTASVDPPLDLAAASPEQRPPLQATMGQLYMRLSQQKQQLAELRQLRGAEASTALLDRAEAVAHRQTRQARRVEDSLQRAGGAVTAAQARQESAQGLLVIHREGVSGGAGQAPLSELLQDALETSRQELLTLQDANSEQREIIFELEKQLMKQVREGDEARAAETLKQLKVQLRDYQVCTQILEWETDDLRAVIEQLRSLEQSAGLESEGDSGIDTRDSGESESSEGDTALRRIIDAPDYDQLAVALRACCSEAGWDAEFLLYGQRQTLEYTTGVPGREIKTLRALKPGGGDPWTTLDGQPAALFSHLRIALKPRGGEARPQPQLRDALAAANACVQRLAMQEQAAQLGSAVEQWTDTSRQALHSIRQQQEQVAKDCKRALARLQSELGRNFMDVNLTDRQRRMMNEALAACQRQVEIRLQQGSQVSLAHQQELERLTAQRVH